MEDRLDVKSYLYEKYKNNPNWLASNRIKTVFQEVLADRVVSVLSQSSVNLRVLFKAADQSSYGYITEEQFSGLLQILWNLDEEEISYAGIQYLIDYVGFEDGKIGYQVLHNSLYTTSHQVQRRERWLSRETHHIRSVVCITRHGARFPLKTFPKCVHWPSNQAFWGAFGGKLTPVGSQQHWVLGQKLHEKYVASERLLEAQAPDLPSRIRTDTSNQDRTLMSAQSLLLGMFPGHSVGFIVAEDVDEEIERTGVPEFMRSGTSEGGRKARNLMLSSSLNVCLSIRAHTPLLHGFKGNPMFEKLKEEAMLGGNFVKWAKDPKYIKLVDKLWRITGFEKLNPKKKMAKRIVAMQSISQQINIERAHQMELFLSTSDEELDLEDEELITEVAEYICRSRYCGHCPEDQRHMARLASGLLPAAIVQGFKTDAEMAEDAGGRFTLYSAHDNTIMALLSHMGFKNYPIPKFAAHVIFELHQIQDKHFVKVLFNPDPEFYGFSCNEQVQEGFLQPVDYFEMPEGEIIDWNNRQHGDDGILLEDFERIMMEDLGSFPSEQAWQEASTIEDETSTSKTPTSPPAFTRMGTLFTELLAKTSMKAKQEKPPLLLFGDQVAGHPLTILALGTDRIAKPVNENKTERNMYVRTFASTFEPQSEKIPKCCDGLQPFMPEFFGQIFVRSKLTESEFEEVGKGKRMMKSRDYDFVVPKRYSAVQIDNAELLDDSETDQMFVDAHVQNAVQRDYFCSTHVPDMVGWVRKRAWPDGAWQKRWMVLHEGALYWYKRQTAYGSNPHLGVFRFAKECEEVLIMADKRMQSITWPKVAGVGLGLLTIGGNVHGLHFETNTTCLRWKGRFSEVMETRTEQYSSQAKLTLGKVSTRMSMSNSSDRSARRSSTRRSSAVSMTSVDFAESPRTSRARSNSVDLSAIADLLQSHSIKEDIERLQRRSSSSDERMSIMTPMKEETADADRLSAVKGNRRRSSSAPIHGLSTILSISNESNGDGPAAELAHQSPSSSPIPQITITTPARTPSPKLPTPTKADSPLPATTKRVSFECVGAGSDGSGNLSSVAEASMLSDRGDGDDDGAGVGGPVSRADSDSAGSDAGNNNRGQVFVVMENLITPFRKPCILDMKLGTRQHPDICKAEKVKKSIKKCAATTSAELGLRVSGMRIYTDPSHEEPQVWSKAYGKHLTKDTFNSAIRTFFDRGNQALHVKAIDAIDKKLEKLEKVLEQLDGYRYGGAVFFNPKPATCVGGHLLRAVRCVCTRTRSG